MSAPLDTTPRDHPDQRTGLPPLATGGDVPGQVLRLDDTENMLKSSFRTMALFEFFADAKRPASIGEIADNLNMPQSSASALTKSLLDSGYLERDVESRAFYPTLRLSFLGDWLVRMAALPDDFTDNLARLSETIGETVFLAMRNGIYSQYIYTHHHDGPVREHVETGSVRPLVCSATGYAMLSGDADADIGKLIRRTVHEVENSFWKETAGAALEGVQDTRAQGYAIAVGPSHESTGGIAVALPSRTVRRHLCVGVGGPADVIRERGAEIAPVLRGFVAGLPRSIEDAILGRGALARLPGPE
ncbi:IclR family transcriptional regulator [Algimonas porphyrae]|nr:helix-turn-helix domain-containing protein [Algimonas porphyrae]